MEDNIREGRLLSRKEDLERTFCDLIDRYIENELPKKPKSHAKQKMQLLWGKSHLGSYFSQSYYSCFDHRSARQAVSWTFTQWCSENIALKIRRSKESKARDRFLEKEEISGLLSACKKSKSPYLLCNSSHCINNLCKER